MTTTVAIFDLDVALIGQIFFASHFRDSNMEKFNEMIVVYSDSESSCDSLQLINPVINLSLEHIEKKKSVQDLDDQSKKFAKLHLNDSNGKIRKRNQTIKQHRHQPYIQPKKRTTIIEAEQTNQCDMKFLKSLGYIRYSSSSKKGKNVSINNDVDRMRSLFIQINNSIKSTFSKYVKSIDQSKENHYICNRRFH